MNNFYYRKSLKWRKFDGPQFNTQLFINGHWKDAAAKETIDVINPATESVIGQMVHARKEDLDEALKQQT